VGNLLKKIGIALSTAVLVVCAAAILVFGLPNTGWKAKVVITGSMRPNIPPGSLVFVHSVPARSLKVGDVITYNSLIDRGQTVTHRIIRVTNVKGIPAFITKGDANESPDPQVIEGQVVGKVVLHVHGAGSILNAAETPAGIGLLVVLPGLIIIFAELTKLGQALTAPPHETVEKAPIHNEGIPPEPKSQHQVAHSAQVAPEPKRSARKNMDGMGRRTLASLIVILSAAGIGHTYAALVSNKVTLAHNTLIVAGSVPPSTANQCKNGGWATFKNPNGSAMFKNQGQCVAFVNSANPGKHISNTTVTIINTNNQSATSGSVSGGGTSGNANNSNSTNTPVTVTN
jgi:signal peptidase